MERIPYDQMDPAGVGSSPRPLIPDPHEASGTVADAVEANTYDDDMMQHDTQPLAVGLRRGRRPVVGRVYDQGEWWRQKGGEWIRIADMEPRHRANTAAMLLRRAGDIAWRLGISELAVFRDAPDDVVTSWMQTVEDREQDPRRWMTGTALYRALTTGLGPDMRPDDVMMAQADRLRPYGVAAFKERLADVVEQVPAATPADEKSGR